MLERTSRPPYDGTAQRESSGSLAAPQGPSKGLVMSLLPSSPMFNLLPSFFSQCRIEPLKSAATDVPHSESLHPVIPRASSALVSYFIGLKFITIQPIIADNSGRMHACSCNSD